MSSKGVSLRKMSMDTGYNYQGVVEQRASGNIPPRIKQTIDFAEYLGVGLEWLVYGGEDKSGGKSDAPDLSRIEDFIQFFMAKSDRELDEYRRILHVPQRKGAVSCSNSLLEA